MAEAPPRTTVAGQATSACSRTRMNAIEVLYKPQLFLDVLISKQSLNILLLNRHMEEGELQSPARPHSVRRPQIRMPKSTWNQLSAHFNAWMFGFKQPVAKAILNS
jgi:hypothetical protein